MGFLDFLLKKQKNTSEQNYKHDIYEMTLSQYSQLPRYYYIRGERYDIDSPESVSNIPICETHFCINNETWGIDTVLREHVSRYFHSIPDILKDPCYSKISELKDNGFYVLSSSEKIAFEEQQKELLELDQNLQSITEKDFEQFNLQKFELINPFVYFHKCIILITDQSKCALEKDIKMINAYVENACSLASIDFPLSIDFRYFEYNSTYVEIENVQQYHTFFEGTPYTKTGKLSKYPLVLHYETSETEVVNFGKIYYLQDGSIGKCRLTFWINHTMYSIELGLKGTTLIVKKVIQDIDGTQTILYKS